MNDFEEMSRALKISQRLLFNALSVADLRRMKKDLIGIIDEVITRKVANGELDPGEKQI